MNDYYATLRIQQGRLKGAMRELGIKTAAELSRRSGVTQSEIGEFLNFRRSPRTKRGRWRKTTLAICRVLGSEPSDIFPEHLDREIPTNRIASFVEHAQLGGRKLHQLAPYEGIERMEMKQTIDEVLRTLLDSERMVLNARVLENKTLTEIAEEMGATRTRVRQIEMRAFRKLRHPSREDRLKAVYAPK